MAFGQSYAVYHGVKSTVSNMAEALGMSHHTADMLGAGVGAVVTKPLALATVDIAGSVAVCADIGATVRRFGDGERATSSQ